MCSFGYSTSSPKVRTRGVQNTAITTKAGLTKSLAGMAWVADAHADDVYPRAYDLSTPHSFREFLDDFRALEAEKCLKAVLRLLREAPGGAPEAAPEPP